MLRLHRGHISAQNPLRAQAGTGSHNVAEESKDQSHEEERGGADASLRGGEGLRVSEHPVLFLLEPLFVQLSAHHLANSLVVSVEPAELKQGRQRIITELYLNYFLSMK